MPNCARHPDRISVNPCERCGAFACGECLEWTSTEPIQQLCTSCFTTYYGQKASTRAVLAIVLGLSMLGCFFPPMALVGWYLGEQELQAIDEGRAPMKGRNLALGARYLGIIGAVLTVLLGAGLVWFFFLTPPLPNSFR